MTEPPRAGDDPVERRSLADAAYARLLEWIMDGTLAAGAPVPLGSVADALGTSQTPLREALARLEGQGLVVRLPMRGFRVAEPLSADEVDDLIEARDLLEPELAARAAARAGPDEVAVLREAWQRTADAQVGPRFEGYRDYLEGSARFHDLVARIAGNRFVRDAVNALPTHVQRFRLFGADGVDDRDLALAEHLEIVDAIAAGDPEAAREAMRRHIGAVGRRSRPGAGA